MKNRVFRRILAMVLAVVLLNSAVDWNVLPEVVYAQGEDLLPIEEGGTNKKYEKLEGYTFSVSIPLALSDELKNLYDNLDNIDDFPKTITGVKVYCGDSMGKYETIEDAQMVISGQTATIMGIPVYIEEGTGSMASGGTGKYTVDKDNFYFIEIPGSVGNDDMYRIDFVDSDSNRYRISGMTLTQNESELIWNAESKCKMLISRRAVKSYSYTVTFSGREEVSVFPEAMKQGMQLSYTENGIEKSAAPSIIYNGNSTFKVLYERIPTSDDIDSTIKLTIPEYDNNRAYVNQNGTDSYVAFNGSEIDSTGYFDELSFRYIQDTSINGKIIWQDADGRDNRLEKDDIENRIKVYKVTDNASADGDVMVEPSEYTVNITESSESASEWDVSITGLPLYDLNGRAIYYFYNIDAADNIISCKDNRHYYKFSYNNTNNTSATDRAYDGCNMYFILSKDDLDYTVKVIWQDDEWNNENNTARIDEVDNGIRIYLWRGTTTNFSDAAPVYDENGNQYKCQLSKDSHVEGNAYELRDADMGLAEGKHLPHYNENGKKYYYFVTAVDNGTNYSISYVCNENHGDEYAKGDHDFVEEGGTIYLTRVGVNNILTTVDWSKALGESDYIGTRAVLKLQRRLKKDKGTDAYVWTDVNTDEITTASATGNNVALYTYFHDIDMYDDKGQSYEFRVLEKNLIDAAGVSTDELTGWKTEEYGDDGNERAATEFTYKNHGYKAYSYYMEKDSAGDIEYKIENRLSADMEYQMYIRWSYKYGSIPNFNFDLYKNNIFKKLSGKYTAPVTYRISQQKSNGSKIDDYATINVTGYDENTKKITYEVILKDTAGETTQQLTGTVTEEKDNDGSLSYQQWAFKGIILPKYDENGYKYTYTIESEASGAGEHADIIADYNNIMSQQAGEDEEYRNLSFYMDRSYDSSSPSVSKTYLMHYLAQTGVSFHIYVKVEWKDSISDIARRQVAAKIVALRKASDGKYYLLKEYPVNINLNTSDSFEAIQYFTPIDSSELEGIRKNNTNVPDDFMPEDIVYTAVEKSITYNGTTYEIPYYNELTKEVNPTFVLTNQDVVSTPMLYATENKQDIKLYAYDINTKEQNNFCQNSKTNPVYSHRKVFYNALQPFTTDISVKVNWHDSDNVSGYRKSKLVVELWRNVDGREEAVTDEQGNIRTITWTTQQEQAKEDSVSYYDKQTFTDLPLFNDDGSGYSYFIRQYIVDENGNRSLIDEKVNAQTTKNYYTTQIKSENTVHIADGKGEVFSDGLSRVDVADYKKNIDITVLNKAENNNYAANFYVIWNDEAAYQKSERADMNYTLYYTVGSDNTKKLYTLSKYNCVVNTADTGSNPYYQRVRFTGLVEYVDGEKVNYYLQEKKIDNTKSYFKYYISYYSYKNTELIDKTNGYYKHKGFGAGIQPTIKVDADAKLNSADSEKCFIAENQVVVNEIYDSVYMSGTKKWNNMSAAAAKPDCTVYLFRHSIYHDEYKKPDNTFESEPAAGTYVAKTTLEDGGLSYKFKKENTQALKEFPKYDEFGAAYTYEIGEIIKDGNGNIMPVDIMLGVADGSNVLVNRFDPYGKNVREITVEKTWTDINVDASNMPYARFYVYRMECNYTDNGIYPDASGVSYEKVVKSQPLSGNAAAMDETLKSLATASKDSSNTVELVESFTLRYTDNVDHKDSQTLDKLNIYAPSGKAYIYFIVEEEEYAPSYNMTNTGADTDSGVRIDTGYRVSDNVVIVSNQQIGLGDNCNNNGAKVSFHNTIKTEKLIKLTGKVKWNEGQTSIKSEARPGITNDKCPNIQLNVWKYSSTQADLDNANQINRTEVKDISVTWKQDENNKDYWKYEITTTTGSGFDIYAPNGTSYYYMVAESFPGNYTVDGNEIQSNMSMNYYISSNNRTKLATSYYTVETGDKVLEIPEICNNLRGTYTVVKRWIDGYDSYGLRPKKVLVMYEYSNDGGNTWKPLTYDTAYKRGSNGEEIVVTVELTKQGGWHSSFSTFPFQTSDKTKTFKYRAVEIGIGYEKVTDGVTDTTWVQTTKLPINGYTLEKGLICPSEADRTEFDSAGDYEYNYNQDYVDASQSVKKVYGSEKTFGSYRVLYTEDVLGYDFTQSDSKTSTITNSLAKSTSLVVNKIWDDDNNIFNLRPDRVKLQLQVRTVQVNNGVVDEQQAGEWHELMDVVVREAGFIKDASGNKWTKTFGDLPVRDENDNFLQYRAVEYGTSKDDYNTPCVITPNADNDYSGYIIESYSMSNYEESHSTQAGNDDSATNTVTITNTLQSDTKVTVNKNWLLGNDIAAGEENENSTASANGYTADVKVCAVYGNESGDYKTLESDSRQLSGSDYENTFDKIPSYIFTDKVVEVENDGKIERKTIKERWTFDSLIVQEVKVNMGGASSVSVDNEVQNKAGASVGVYTALDKKWIAQSDYNVIESNGTKEFTWTITNSPLVEHTLHVEYKGDSEQNTRYSTRPSKVMAKLQYRIIDSGKTEWKNVDTTSDFYKSLLKSVQYQNVAGTDAADDTYDITIGDLPLYVNVGSGSDLAWKKYQYRIIETDTQYKDGNTTKQISVEYDDEAKTTLNDEFKVSCVDKAAQENTYGKDRSIGGYTYAYTDMDNNSDSTKDTDSITYLRKELLKVKVVGTKLWNDQSDMYGTRAQLPVNGIQVSGEGGSDVQIGIYKGKETNLVDVKIMWKAATDTDKWTYETEAVLPKYASGTQQLEAYTVKETENTSDYEVSYGDAADKENAALKEGVVVGAGSGEAYELSDITNNLIEKDLTITKVWESAAVCSWIGITQKSAVFTVQVSNDDGKTYTTLMHRVGNDNVPLTVTLTCPPLSAGDTARVQSSDSDTLKKLPMKDKDGNEYHYRILETEIVVGMMDGSDEKTVTFSLVEDGENYLVKQKIGEGAVTDFPVGSGTKISKASLAASLIADKGFSYELGIFNAEYKESSDGLVYTNTAVTARASADVKWIETLVGSSKQDETLIENFRPDGLTLVLQRKVEGASDTAWSNVTASDGTSDVTVSKEITTSPDEFEISYNKYSQFKELPVYVLKDGVLKTYEYRIVESEFAYKDSLNQETKRPLNYKIGGQSDMYADFNANILKCNDKLDGAENKDVFYEGTQSNEKTVDDKTWEFKTSIENELHTENLNKQVFTKLTGTITWLDNKNQLEKRPDVSGLPMVLRVQTGSDKTDKGEAGFIIGNGSNLPDGNEFTDNLASITENAKIKWTKTESTWSYEITGLPVYDENGGYITYSVCHDTNTTDYTGEADRFDNNINQNISADKKYAYGTVQDLKNDYNSKIVEYVDFVENLNTKLTIVKTWVEGNNKYWQTRPQLEVFLQSRVITALDSQRNIVSASAWRESFNEAAEGRADDTEHYFSLEPEQDKNKEYYFTLKSVKNVSGRSELTYERILPQYEVSKDRTTFSLIQYRVAEIGKEVSADNSMKDVLLDAVSGEVQIADSVTRTGTPHIGSYYLRKYDVLWDNGYTTVEMENFLDKREDITVKKEWNTADSDTTDMSVTVRLYGVTHDGSFNRIVTVPGVLEQTLDESNSWEYTYKDLPKYDINFNEINWNIQELKIKTGSSEVEVGELKSITGDTVGLSSDEKWLVKYSTKTCDGSSEGQSNTGLAGLNDKIIFTVKNIQTTTAKLTVDYKNDFNNLYRTRFEKCYGQLQYRVAGSSEWKPAAGDLADCIIGKDEAGITAVRDNSGNITGITKEAKDSASDSYVYLFENLPEYLTDDNNILLHLEYRIVESEQVKLGEVQYQNSLTDDIKAIKLVGTVYADNTDYVSGGYTYSYDYAVEQSDARLEKELLKVTLQGQKLWVDTNNKYRTRPDIAENGEVQSNSSDIRITVSEMGVTALSSNQPEITWKADSKSGNVWNYSTTQLPRYRSQSDDLAVYEIKEKCGYKNYDVSYAQSRDGADSESATVSTIVKNSVGEYTYNMSEITNTLEYIDIVVNKKWYNRAGKADKDAVFTLQSKTGNEAEYADVIGDYYPVKQTMDKDKNILQVSWEGLPAKNEAGEDISYHVVEGAIEGYEQKYDIKVSDDNKTITYNFVNIELQDYTVKKVWKDTIKGIQCMSDGTYKAEGILQMKLESSSEWTNLEDRSWSFTNTYDETKDASVNSYTFKDLPEYDPLTGERICYRAVEQRINGKDIMGSEGEAYGLYTTEYDTSLEQTIVRNTLKAIEYEIIKTDKTSNEPMKGVVFKLTLKDNPDISYSGTTDENGRITMQVLSTGTYILTEESTQSGYIKMQPEEIILSESNIHKKITKEIANERKLGTLVIHKNDAETGEAIDGVRFALYRETAGANAERIGSFETGTADEAGVAKITDIPWGRYYIVEERADGYILSSTKYYFNVNAATVEQNIELESAGGNIILNYKNSFTFQKQSLDGTILDGGSYELCEVNADGSTTPIKEFTIGKAAVNVLIRGTKAGKYVIKEIAAPEYHNISEEGVELYIDADGNILKAEGGEAWPNNQVVLKDMPVCSLKVTKVFDGDSLWLNTFRPKTVKLQLYSYENEDFSGEKTAVGDIVEIAVDKEHNQFGYVFENLPMYKKDGTSRLYYAAEEIENNPIYKVSYIEPIAAANDIAGKEYEETINNKIADATYYYVTKMYDENIPESAKFEFDIKIGADEDNLVTYYDKYYVGSYNEDTKALDTNGDIKAGDIVNESDDSVNAVKLGRGETFCIPIPEGAVCVVTEQLDNVEQPEYTNTEVMDKNNPNHKIVINKKRVYTKIENITPNVTADISDIKTNAGGLVGVITGDDEGNIENPDEVAYQRQKYIVYWKPMKDWVISSDFKLYYKETSDAEEKVVTVEGYLNENGEPDDSKLDILRQERYDRLDISKTDDTIMLYLSDSTDGMPYLNRVEVEFLPTIAIMNITENQVGGQVKCEGGNFYDDADGKGKHNDSRHVNKTTLYAKAKNGY